MEVDARKSFGVNVNELISELGNCSVVPYEGASNAHLKQLNDEYDRT